MNSDQLVTIVNTLSGLVAVLVGVLSVTPVLTLGTVVVIVRTIRHNPALEHSIEALYKSMPAPIQRDVTQAGALVNEVGGLLTDISSATTTGNTSSTVIAAQSSTTTAG